MILLYPLVGRSLTELGGPRLVGGLDHVRFMLMVQSESENKLQSLRCHTQYQKFCITSRTKKANDVDSVEEMNKCFFLSAWPRILK